MNRCSFLKPWLEPMFDMEWLILSTHPGFLMKRTHLAVAHIVTSALFFSLLLPAPVFAGQYEDIVAKAFEALSDYDPEAWLFTEITRWEGMVIVARHDSRGGENSHWTLLSVDGREATEDELEEFIAEKRSHYEPEPEEDDGADSVVQAGTLELVEETGDYWLFSFVPSEDDEVAGYMEHLDGTMKIVKNGHYVENINLRNETTFKPATGVKIKEFRTRLEFGPVATGGPIVPKSVDVHISGRAFLAVKIDEAESVSFQNYEYLGEQ